MAKTLIMGKSLIRFILMILLFASPQSFAYPQNASDQRAIDAFLKIQKDKTDAVLNAQIAELMQARFTEKGATDAVLLGGGCGVVGCFSTLLVTTEYYTRGANTRSAIVAAIVTNPTGREFRVKRILSRSEIESLINPK
jgi:hypothetical protein